jgi:rhodanese-related sulfurtransferase
MKKIILSILILTFVFFGNTFAEIKNFSALTTEEFKKEIKNSIVIDIRTPDEIALGKITEDALEIDYYNPNFKNDLDKLDKNKKYLIYCAHGNRTRDTKNIMKELGFKKVNDLEGGIAK